MRCRLAQTCSAPYVAAAHDCCSCCCSRCKMMQHSGAGRTRVDRTRVDRNTDAAALGAARHGVAAPQRAGAGSATGAGSAITPCGIVTTYAPCLACLRAAYLR